MDKRKITDLIPDDKNLNRGTRRGKKALEKSVTEYGAGRSILLDKNGRIIAGNKTVEEAKRAGITEVLVVETDGQQLVAVKRQDLDLDSKKGRGLALADNRAGQLNLSWDSQVLEELAIAGTIELDEWFDPDELAAILETENPSVEEWGESTDLEESDYAEEKAEECSEVPNTLFSSSNDWDIPDLDPDLQATADGIEWLAWGSTIRVGQHNGGIHFYTDDYRFSALWQTPNKLLATGCHTIIEPNYTTWRNEPRALALTEIYKKRWLARYWQSHGIRVWVDLDVGENITDINLLGVPKTWRMFATHYARTNAVDKISAAGMDEVRVQWEQILSWSDCPDDCRLLVYGGSPRTFANAPDAWIHVLEHNDLVRGRYKSG